ncbi:MAG TPA: CAP domain-containing protein [Bacteroidia bacterium]|jgi:hypothetical protein|nr:CAP domain-containing protein [Bacteroidia bacterium]
MFRKISVLLSVALVITISCLSLQSFISANPGGGMFIDKAQAQKALVLLNKIRKDPNSYSERLGFSLRGISPRGELQWDDSLCAVAERRALSMASRGWFGDVDPDGYGVNYYVNKAAYSLTDEQIKHKKESNFAAIEGGAPSGEIAINNIIIDKDKLGDSGRKLLLGIGDVNAALVDVGIGYVHGTGSTKYRSYTCVIIAKRSKPLPTKASY